MRDELEAFVAGHRDEFDTEAPGGYVWQSISAQLQQKRKKDRGRYMALAASVLIIVGAFAFFFYGSGQDRVATPQIALAPQVQQAEEYYSEQVRYAMAELDRYSKEYPELCQDFSRDIQALDTAYSQLKIEYQGANGNEAVIRAMIENLRTQLRILNLQLQIIHNIKQKETRKHTS